MTTPLETLRAMMGADATTDDARVMLALLNGRDPQAMDDAAFFELVGRVALIARRARQAS